MTPERVEPEPIDQTRKSRVLRTWRERLRTALVNEPVLISLTLRWFGWFVALVIVVTEAAPAPNLVDGPMVLVATFICLVLMSIYPKYMRPRLPGSFAAWAPAVWPAADGVIALWSIYQTGGWDSPFYHFAVTVVLAPSLRFGLVGALASSTLFSLAFVGIIKLTAEGFGPAYAGSQAEPDLVSSPLNPLMIGLYAAFLGEVLKKLERETKRSEKLAAENERQRMARDIHDGVSQTLFMLSMSLETGQVLAEKESAQRTAEHLKNLTPVAQKALMELRNAMFDVEPLAEGKQTLVEAVTQLARDYRSATGQDIQVDEADDFKAPTGVESELFRMLQETVANACQHSGAQKITVHFRPGAIEVQDNGCGFDASKIKPGRGLGNLELRAQQASLGFALESDDNGTRVKFSWEEDKA